MNFHSLHFTHDVFNFGASDRRTEGIAATAATYFALSSSYPLTDVSSQTLDDPETDASKDSPDKAYKTKAYETKASPIPETNALALAEA